MNWIIKAVLCLIITVWVGAQNEEYNLYDYSQEETEEEALIWTEREGFEYHFSDDRQNFNKASSMCLEQNGNHISITDSKENSWVHEQRYTSRSYWIGLRNGRSTGKNDLLDWRWADFSEGDYRNWRSDEPKTKGDACAAFEDKNDAKWYTFRCSAPRHYICKRKISPCNSNPCQDYEECVAEGDSYECKCPDCPSDTEKFFNSVSASTPLLVVVIVVVLIVVIIVLVIVGTCVRGCVEQRQTRAMLIPTKTDKKSDEEDVALTDYKNASKPGPPGNMYNTCPKPPLPPNKPDWKRNQSETSPSLSDSARGRSANSSESEEESETETKVNIELHNEHETSPLTQS